MLSLRTLAARRPLSILQRRFQSQEASYQPPTPTPPPAKQPNPHSNFYRQFGRPVLKNFLIAVATYQILYFSWLKLESMEMKQEKQSEMERLETALSDWSGQRAQIPRSKQDK